MRNTRINQKFKSEQGLVIVEASIVFPIMFIILFFLIYFGNAYYEKAKIDDLVVEQAILGASYCADPMLAAVKADKIPSVKEVEIEPYRYIFGNMNDIENLISDNVKKSISGKDQTVFFKNMEPKLKTSTDQIAKFNNYVLYSTFSVEVNYVITLPITFWGEKGPPLLSISAIAEVPVSDTPEFIRNTDMVLDLFPTLNEKISDKFGKINDFIEQFANK